MSSKFIIVLQEGKHSEVEEKLQMKDIPYHSISNKAILVSYEGLSSELKEISGISDGKTASGAIFGLTGAYSGFASRDLWEWLNKYE